MGFIIFCSAKETMHFIPVVKEGVQILFIHNLCVTYFKHISGDINICIIVIAATVASLPFTPA